MKRNMNFIWKKFSVADPDPIRSFFDPYIRDLGWVGNKSRSGSGIRIRDKHPGSYFLELRNNFWVRILKFFDVDADPRSGNLFYSGSGMDFLKIIFS
jgi:hypothetical protein